MRGGFKPSVERPGPSGSFFHASLFAPHLGAGRLRYSACRSRLAEIWFQMLRTLTTNTPPTGNPTSVMALRARGADLCSIDRPVAATQFGLKASLRVHNNKLLTFPRLTDKAATQVRGANIPATAISPSTRFSQRFRRESATGHARVLPCCRPPAQDPERVQLDWQPAGIRPAVLLIHLHWTHVSSSLSDLIRRITRMTRARVIFRVMPRGTVIISPCLQRRSERSKK